MEVQPLNHNHGTRNPNTKDSLHLSSNQRKRNKSNDNHQNPKKRSKKQKFWIESCKHNSPPKNYPLSMLFQVHVTVADLTDDFFLQAVDRRNSNHRIEDHHDDQVNHEDKLNPWIYTATNASTATDETDASSPIIITEPFIVVTKSSSALQKLLHSTQSSKKFIQSNKQQIYQPLPHGDCGDGILNPYPIQLVPNKYWAQRKRLFHKYDEGIQLDQESWYSVTPEVIAHHIAQRVTSSLSLLSHRSQGIILLDPFCGVGGNVIAFAQRINEISLVICCDIDMDKLQMAAHNASIYGIPCDKMVFIHGSAMEVMRRYQKGVLQLQISSVESMSNTSIGTEEMSSIPTTTYKGYPMGDLSLLPKEIHVIFLSPPWGGIEYLQHPTYDLSTCIQLVDHPNNSITGSNNRRSGGGGSSSSATTATTTTTSVATDTHDTTVLVNGIDLLRLASRAAWNQSVIYFLPKNVHGIELGKMAFQLGYKNGMEMEQNRLNGKLKTVTIYLLNG